MVVSLDAQRSTLNACDREQGGCLMAVEGVISYQNDGYVLLDREHGQVYPFRLGEVLQVMLCGQWHTVTFQSGGYRGRYLETSSGERLRLALCMRVRLDRVSPGDGDDCATARYTPHATRPGDRSKRIRSMGPGRVSFLHASTPAPVAGLPGSLRATRHAPTSETGGVVVALRLRHRRELWPSPSLRLSHTKSFSLLAVAQR